MVPAASTGARTTQRAGRPRDLFADYLDARGHADDGVRDLFDQLYEEASASGGA
jgi:exonuclease SbcD